MTEPHRTIAGKAAIAEDLALIRAAAEEGGRIAMAYFRGKKAMDVRMKGGNSPVSAGDIATDTFLRKFLLAARPDYGWLSEESVDTSRVDRRAAPRGFIVDPIDGTRAFIDGCDIWCVSIGIVEGTVPVAGVLESPALGESCWASAGGGAFKNGVRLAVGAHNGEVVVAGPKNAEGQLARAFPDGFRRRGHIPSLAYRLAMVADGTLDATLIKPRSHDWDIAAAALILTEAGAGMATLEGGDVVLNGDSVVKPAMIAGSPAALRAMLGVVTEEAFS